MLMKDYTLKFVDFSSHKYHLYLLLCCHCFYLTILKQFYSAVTHRIIDFQYSRHILWLQLTKYLTELGLTLTCFPIRSEGVAFSAFTNT